MTRVTALGCAAGASLLLIVGCGGTPVPTRPSLSTPGASIGVAGPSGAAPVISAWRCFAKSAAGTPGIFAGGVREAASCPAPSLAMVFDSALAAPGVPSNLTSSVSGSTVTLTWHEPATVDGAASYGIEAGSSTGAADLANVNTGSTATSFQATDVPAGTYFVRVRARNSAGVSAASNEAVVTVGGGSCASAPNAPAGLLISIVGGTVSLTWTAPAVGCAPTGYVIEAGSTTGSSNLANLNTGSAATAFSAPGVPDGTYYVRVLAQNGRGASAASNEVIATVGSAADGLTDGLRGEMIARFVDVTLAAFADALSANNVTVRRAIDVTDVRLINSFRRTEVPCPYGGTVMSEVSTTGSVGSSLGDNVQESGKDTYKMCGISMDHGKPVLIDGGPVSWTGAYLKPGGSPSFRESGTVDFYNYLTPPGVPGTCTSDFSVNTLTVIDPRPSAQGTICGHSILNPLMQVASLGPRTEDANQLPTTPTLTANPNPVSLITPRCSPVCTVSKTTIVTSCVPWTVSWTFGIGAFSSSVTPTSGPAGSTPVTVSFSGFFGRRETGYLRFATTNGVFLLDVSVIQTP